jgi:hypothetical protein
VNWDWDYEGFGDLLQGSEMLALMREQAEAIEARAVALSPVGEERNGHYVERFKVTSGVEDTHTGRRAVARVTNTSDYALDVEYGSGGRSGRPGHKPHHPLTRALDG